MLRCLCRRILTGCFSTENRKFHDKSSTCCAVYIYSSTQNKLEAFCFKASPEIGMKLLGHRNCLLLLFSFSFVEFVDQHVEN